MDAKVISEAFSGTVRSFSGKQDDILRCERDIRELSDRLEALQIELANNLSAVAIIEATLKSMCKAYIGKPALFTAFDVLVDKTGVRKLEYEERGEALRCTEIVKFG